jgi:hypothetical protein
MLVSSAAAYHLTLPVCAPPSKPPRSWCLRMTDAPEESTPAPPESYTEAEARGFELYKAGKHERAIRMFELAQTLPGAGVDFQREKQGGMIGSSFAPPNPREWAEKRFATPEQKLIAQYNSATTSASPFPYPPDPCAPDS